MLRPDIFKYKWVVLTLLICILSSSPKHLLSQSEELSRIKVLSWNIQMLPDFFSPFSELLRKNQKDRLPEIMKYLYRSDYDIIVLQEVFDANIKRKMKRFLRIKYPYIQMPVNRKIGWKGTNGIMVLSKYPMKYVDHIIYDAAEGYDAATNKGCVLVEIDINGDKWFVAGTHLQASGQHIRDLQYKQIKTKIISPYLKDDLPFLLAGDLNTEKGSVSYSNMLSLFKLNNTDILDERPYTSDTTNSWKSSGESKQIDYVLYDLPEVFKISNHYIIRPSMVYENKKMDLADHYGIVLEISQ